LLKFELGEVDAPHLSMDGSSSPRGVFSSSAAIAMHDGLMARSNIASTTLAKFRL